MLRVQTHTTCPEKSCPPFLLSITPSCQQVRESNQSHSSSKLRREPELPPSSASIVLSMVLSGNHVSHTGTYSITSTFARIKTNNRTSHLNSLGHSRKLYCRMMTYPCHSQMTTSLITQRNSPDLSRLVTDQQGGPKGHVSPTHTRQLIKAAWRKWIHLPQLIPIFPPVPSSRTLTMWLLEHALGTLTFR